MAGMYTASMVLITPYVNVMPKQDTLKVENRLLDGTFHVQILGTAAALLTVTVQAVDETTRALIDAAEGTGEEIRIEDDTNYWNGIIRLPLVWEKTAGIFKTTFDLLVLSSGLIE